MSTTSGGNRIGILRLFDILGEPTSRRIAVDTQAVRGLYLLAMIVVIVAVDILIFRHHFWQRLVANAGIVLVFGAVYFRFLR